MKKRNKYFEKEKLYRKLNQQLDKNSNAQYNLGWVDIDVPIFKGYRAYLEPRSDIQNREDAWVFWELCKTFGTTSFARKIKDFDWESKKYRKDGMHIYHMPKISAIGEYTYFSIDQQIAKWFTNEVQFADNDVRKKWGTNYYCKVPNFFFEIKYEKVYTTKIKLFDSVLKQEEAEIKSRIERDFYYKTQQYNNAPKSFRKGLNKTQRAKSRGVLHNIVYKEFEREFEDCYKGANWLYW